MSRGGRGGFGGGRGGPGGANSGAMQLVSFDMLKDLSSGGLFNVNTALFPEMDVPIPRKPNSTENSQWKFKEEFLKQVHESAYHLVPPPPKPDIERYSDKYKLATVRKKTLREIDTDFDFFPEELQSVIDPSKAKKKRKVQKVDDNFNLDDIINAEEKDKDGEDDQGKEEKEGDAASDLEIDEEGEEEELVDDNDYAQNYFDNGEDEDFDDDDGDGGAGDYY
ncbi:DNA-directed RNA polymerase III, subunit Rpc31 [Phycomyces nitens]|nr:DNA-directed RNA polymerase III, subunit Rpc31 [Phycomyces nitens]